MLHLTADTQILLAAEPVDFRRGIDGLAALCEQQLNQSPRSGCLFVFINRARTMIRALCYEECGYWLATKRLSRGRYSGWPKIALPVEVIAPGELRKILSTFIARSPHSV